MFGWILHHPFLIIGLLLLFLLIYYSVRPYILRSQLPPGPLPLPLLGNLLLFRGSKRTIFHDVIGLGKKYGEPLTLWFGLKPQIYINSMDGVREAFIDNQHDFASRPNNVFMKMLLPNDNTTEDIIWGKYSPIWQAHKKFGSKVVRRVMDSNRLEANVIEATDQVVEELRSIPSGEPIDIAKYTTNLVYNILAALCFGIRYSMDDPKFIRLMEIRNNQQNIPSWFFLVLLLPGIDRFPELLKRIPAGKRLIDESREQLVDIQAYVDEHKLDFEQRRGTHDEVRDIVDAMLLEQDELVTTAESELGALTDAALVLIVFDIFAAGTETTAATIRWFVLEMVMNPVIQERCAVEIRKVVGNGVPTLEDRPKLQLLEATILEVLRLHPVAPLGVPHAASKSSAVLCDQYKVPANATILYNIYAIQRDEKLFENPTSFYPERFIDAETNKVLKPPGWIPFGVGRRVCMGETVAKNDLFMICCSLLQYVRFKPVPGMEYSTEPGMYQGGLGNMVKNELRFIVEMRNDN